jgi:serine/threonine protein kinase
MNQDRRLSANEETLPPNRSLEESVLADPDQTLASDAKAGQPVADADNTLQYLSHVPGSANRISIPGYELIKELGRGAMGVVYQARQVRADRLVALKVMSHIEHAKPEDIDRFTIEAQASAQLHHPNIVQVYEVGQSGHLPYFTQEFVSGGTLARRISKELLSHQETARVMLALAQAVSYAHSKQIVHRDLKPLNVLLDEHHNPKVADFGLARRMEDQSHLTQDGTILGTPSYMAPEQASGNKHAIGPLSDVYSLGAILYELLTGRPPFKGATIWEVVQQVRNTDPVPPSQLQSGIPADLETICLKCLQKLPERRYASAQQLADDLQRHIRHEPILARPIGQWERLVRLCQRNPREAKLVGFLAALMMCFGIGASWTAYRINRDRNHIEKQRDEITDQKNRIEKQRDEIAVEKNISDQRLSLYRDTVSKMVNRVPRLLENAPIGTGTRNELHEVIGSILSDSNHTGVVGSARDWGLMATALRAGETKLSSALSLRDSHDAEGANRAFEETRIQFEQAAQIAKQVYDSEEPDRGKAASNLSLVLMRLVRLQGEWHPQAWKASVPNFKKAIDYSREAVAFAKAATTSQSESLGLYQSQLAHQLGSYAEFLMDAAPMDPNHHQRATELLLEANPIFESVSQSPDVSSTLRFDCQQHWASSLQTQARIAVKRKDVEAAKAAYQQACQLLDTLLEAYPDRFTLLLNAVNCHNGFGDLLLEHGASPTTIEPHYAKSLDCLMRLLRTPQQVQLEQNGLALQFYRLGLLASRNGDAGIANQHFQHSALLRKLGLVEKMRGSQSQNDEALLQTRVPVMLAYARCGDVEETTQQMDAVLEVIGQADFQGKPTSKGESLVLLGAAKGILSEAIRTRNVAQSEQLFEEAKSLIVQGVKAGYRDLNYLASDPDFEWIATHRDGAKFFEELKQLQTAP